MRFALGHALAGTRPQVAFRDLDLSGLSTLVLSGVTVGRLDDPDSAVIRELRLKFDLGSLVRRDFDVASSLRHVEIVSPQVTVTLPRETPSGPLPALPLPGLKPGGGVSLEIRDGRLLLRTAGKNPKVAVVSDMDAGVFPTGPDSVRYSFACTAPASPRRGVRARGTYSAGHAGVILSLSDLDFAAVRFWSGRIGLPSPVKSGRISASLKAVFTRSPAGSWRLARTDGRLDLSGAGVETPRLPFPLENVTGRAAIRDDRIDVGHLSLNALERDWSLRGTLIVAGSGDAITFENAAIRGAEGEIRFAGSFQPGVPSARLSWKYSPGSLRVPAASGSSFWLKDGYGAEINTDDGAWSLNVTGTREDLRWSANVRGRARAGATLDLSGTVQASAPHRIGAAIRLRGARLADLYLDRRHPVLERLKGLTIAAAGNLSGPLADPELAASVDGSVLKSGEQAFTLAGGINVRRSGLKLSALKLTDGTTVTLDLPFAATGGSLRVSARELPLKLIWQSFPPPAGADALSGVFQGTITATDLNARPRIRAAGEVRSLKWSELDLGVLSLAAEAAGKRVEVKRLALRGPACAADASGTVNLLETGWNGSGEALVSYLKAGRTDLEARATLAASAVRDGSEFTARLTALRLNARAGPDFSLSVRTDKDGATVKAAWEEHLSAVARFEREPPRGGTGAPEYRSVSLTAACSELPLDPIAGAFSLPGPAERASGAVTLKGAMDRANLSANLNWPGGDLQARGEVDARSLDTYSLTLTAAEARLSAWLPLLRAFEGFGDLPEAEGAIAARGFSIAREPEGLAASGWIALRDLAVEGRRIGTGSLRVKADRGRGELEASLEGDGGKYTIYPTRFRTEEGERVVEGSFAWSKVPAGRAECSLSRGTLSARMRGSGGTAAVSLQGLSLGAQEPIDVAFDLARDGDRWRVSSPDSSAWRLQGTVSLAGTAVSVEEGDPASGKWLVLHGPAGASMRIAGSWTVPSVPRQLKIEARRFPATPLCLVIGAPPLEGMAEVDLAWTAAAAPPLKGALTMTGGRWGDFPFDTFSVGGSGTPGREFRFSRFSVRRPGELDVEGSGTLTTFPEDALELDLTVNRLLLRYLKPFGFVEDSDVAGSGSLRISGNPDDPAVNGTITCSPGSVSPPTGFAELKLVSGRIGFEGKRAVLNALLNDAAGAAVLVSGESEYRGLVPTRFSIAMTAPAPIWVDGLPRLYKGRAKGKVLFEGTMAEPSFGGEVFLQEGRLQNPPRKDPRDPDALVERLDWRLTVHFGKDVHYAVEPVGGAALDLALLSPRSRIQVRGKGDDFQVYGKLYADSGPLTLFLGKNLWDKEPR